MSSQAYKDSLGNGAKLPVSRGTGAKDNVRDTGSDQPFAEKEIAFVRGRVARAIAAISKKSGIAPDMEPVTHISSELRNMAEFVERYFHRGVIYYRSADSRAHSGFYLQNQPDVIFVNVEGDDAPRQIIGHELLHALRKANPGAYQVLSNAISKLIRNESNYAESLASPYANIGRAAPVGDALREELKADFAAFDLDHADRKDHGRRQQSHVLDRLESTQSGNCRVG